MEHREPPRISTPEAIDRDAGDPVTARRFARFVPAPNVRRLAVSRIGLAILTSVGILGLILIAFSQGLHTAVGWLHHRPEYAIDPAAIVLEPPPPPWLRGGPNRFVDRVLAAHPDGKGASVLDLDLEQVVRDFRQHCWVRRVLRVRRSYPNRLTVALEYRTPVALVHFAAPATEPDVLIDDEGVLLPPEDVDRESAGLRWILISWRGPPPSDRRPGVIWKKEDLRKGTVAPEARILDAARLSSFLVRTRHGEDGRATPLGDPAISADPGMLWVLFRVRGELWTRWGAPPGSEAPGEPTAAEKWRRLGRWLETQGGRGFDNTHYLIFTRDGVRYPPTS